MKSITKFPNGKELPPRQPHAGEWLLKNVPSGVAEIEQPTKWHYSFVGQLVLCDYFRIFVMESQSEFEGALKSIDRKMEPRWFIVSGASDLANG